MISLKENIKPIFSKEDCLFESNLPQNSDESNQISTFSLKSEINTEIQNLTYITTWVEDIQ